MKLLARLVEKISDHPVLFIFFRSLLESNFRAVKRQIVQELPRRDLRTLDLGCGPGAFAVLFAPGDYVGVDLNPRYIEWARRHRPGEFIAADARAIPLPDRRFDQALVYGLLHHLSDADLRAVLREACRLLEPGSRILLIEDIPAVSRLNMIGHLIHNIENGKFIRPPADYRRLYAEFGALSHEEIMRSGICDYYKVVLTIPAAG